MKGYTFRSTVYYVSKAPTTYTSTARDDFRRRCFRLQFFSKSARTVLARSFLSGSAVHYTNKDRYSSKNNIRVIQTVIRLPFNEAGSGLTRSPSSNISFWSIKSTSSSIMSDVDKAQTLAASFKGAPESPLVPLVVLLTTGEGCWTIKSDRDRMHTCSREQNLYSHFAAPGRRLLDPISYAGFRTQPWQTFRGRLNGICRLILILPRTSSGTTISLKSFKSQNS